MGPGDTCWPDQQTDGQGAQSSCWAWGLSQTMRKLTTKAASLSQALYRDSVLGPVSFALHHTHPREVKPSSSSSQTWRLRLTEPDLRTSQRSLRSQEAADLGREHPSARRWLLGWPCRPTGDQPQTQGPILPVNEPRNLCI